MEQKKPASAPNKTKLLIALGIFILIVLFSAGSYWLGSKGKPQASPSPSPTANPEASTTTEPETSPATTLSSPEPSPSPQPSPSPETQTITLKSQAGHDGFRASNGGGNNTVDIRIGRNSTLIIRGFLSFKLEDIPADATIESAKLRVYQHNIVGDPYAAGIRVVVDHLEYGDNLDNSAYNAPSISANFAILSTNSSTTWYEVDITDRLRDDLNNSHSRSQYRLHLATETIGGTPSGDFAYFESGDNYFGTNNVPELYINYH